jgi:phosphoribulokinase
LRRTSEKNRQAEIYASAFHRHSKEEEEEEEEEEGESDNCASFFSETAFHTGSLEEEFFFGGGSIIFSLAFVMRVKKMKIRYSESSSLSAMWPSFGFRPVLLLDAF